MGAPGAVLISPSETRAVSLRRLRNFSRIQGRERSADDLALLVLILALLVSGSALVLMFLF